MKIKCVTVGLLATNCYIVSGNDGNKDFLMVIDPGANFPLINESIDGVPTHIVITHAHFDHVGAMHPMLEAYPDVQVCVSAFENTDKEQIEKVCRGSLRLVSHHFDGLTGFRVDRRLHDGDVVCGFKVIFTPGHSPGSICLYNEKEKILFSGDTIFKDGCGRTDLGGNADDMAKSLDLLLKLNPDTEVYPGHGDKTTIGYEAKGWDK